MYFDNIPCHRRINIRPSKLYKSKPNLEGQNKSCRHISFIFMKIKSDSFVFKVIVVYIQFLFFPNSFQDYPKPHYGRIIAENSFVLWFLEYFLQNSAVFLVYHV